MNNLLVSADRPSPGRIDAGKSERETTFTFVAFSVLLASIVFLTPVGDSWMRSRVDEIDDVNQVDSNVSQGNAARQLVLGGAGMVGLLAVFWPGGKRFKNPGLLAALCVAYVAWCGASYVWSDEPAMSLRRWGAFLCEIAAALGVAKFLSVRRFVLVVFSCTLAWMLLGIAAELSLNTFRPWESGYRFAGVFHPNGMGINCAALALSSLYLASVDSRNRHFLLATAIVALAFLVLTGSRTSLLAVFTSFGAYWFLGGDLAKRIYGALILAMTLAMVLVIFSLGFTDLTGDILSMGRKDHEMNTLTGRVPLWEELVKDYVRDYPLMGHGYGAFWTEERIIDISRSQTWVIGSAHSTYVDMVLSVGIVGALLCLAAMAVAIFQFCRLDKRYEGSGYGFMAMFVILAMTVGLLETVIGLTSFVSFFGICSVCYLLYEEEAAVMKTSVSRSSLRVNRPRKVHAT